MKSDRTIQVRCRELTALAAAVVATMAGGAFAESAGQEAALSSNRVPNPAQGGVAGALMPCEYAVDDGTGENGVGLTGGGTILWANAFEATPGCDVITGVRVTFFSGTFTPGSAGKVFVYDDPDDDGDPNNAVLLAIADIVTANENTDTFNDYAIGPVVVSGTFFVGAMVVHAGGEFPARFDSSSASQMMSFLGTNPGNPDNPLVTSGVAPAASFGLDGNYMVRALGEPPFDPCPADSNGDFVVNVDDLVNLITSWGDCDPPPAACESDSNGDGVVNVDDLVSLITGWGTCEVLNDDCAARQEVFSGFGEVLQGVETCEPRATSFHNIEATTDGPTVSCDTTAGSDVWFNYTAVCDGQVTIDTNGSDFDTVLEVWAGSACPVAGAPLACDNDSGADGEDSRLVLLVNSGDELKIRVSGSPFGGSQGIGQLNICCSTFLPDPPPNDDCANAITLAPGQSDIQQTITASVSPEAFTCGTSVQAPGAWYRTIGTGNSMTALLCGAVTDYDALLNVYCGPCTNLRCIGGDDDSCGVAAGPSRLSWCSEAGREYLIYVQGFAGGTGNFQITIADGSPCGTPAECTEQVKLANDDCADAIPLVEGMNPYSNLDATTDGPAHPACAIGGDGGNTTEDIWFTYTACMDGLLQITTCEDLGGSATHDSDIVIYDPSSVAGPVCDNLLEALYACNDDDPNNACGSAPDYHSTVQVPIANGQEYLVRVGSWNTGNSGTGVLLVQCLPADDDFCDFATDLTTAAPVQLDTCSATIDGFAPICTSAAPSEPGRWLRVVGTGSTLTLSLCNSNDPGFPGSAPDTRLMVYCGPCDELECVAGEPTNNGSCPGTERLSWCSEPGRAYYALVHGQGNPGCGIIDATLAQGLACNPDFYPCPPTPFADACADAINITSAINGDTVVGDNSDATPLQNDGGPGDPELPIGSPSCQWQNPVVPTNTHNTVWYSVVAPANGSITFQTCGTIDNNDTILALYSGTCGSLTELFCAEDQCGSNGYRSELIATGLTPGATYRLMVANPGGWGGSTPGEFFLDVFSP